jgi:L,D-peptidoglycan transpeptidase YkuD (ErfK/YbiS/YcfS/YnhG family)
MRTLAFSGACFVLLLCRAAVAANPCAPGLPYLHVDTTLHRLFLCEAGDVQHEYSVRLGKGGVGKTREGDGKTPLGAYALGEPRASARYGVFIPIDYPTKAQQALGYTGSAVGLHGPRRGLQWLGDLVNALDTTEGCVGIARDQEMSEIVAWLHRTGSSWLVLQ